MRRRSGALLPLEVEVLGTAAAANRAGDPWVHGFAVARRIRDAKAARPLTAHGTLYKALGRLVDARMLEDEWEDPEVALADRRPRRRLYRITGLGEQTLAAALADSVGTTSSVEPRAVPACRADTAESVTPARRPTFQSPATVQGVRLDPSTRDLRPLGGRSN